ncbi:YegP family protein [Draconibacterium sp.]|nr:YegP family protein [Draconibacterium sp.]
MDTKNYIVKNEKTVPAEDYSFLRSKGLELIEKLSNKIWTDFNIHDPGITILEVLCYAITDVAYRTSFDVKDLLTAKKDQGGINELYSAREILTCNPVTINDFRKILIDVEGVKNAWLNFAKEQEQSIFIDCKKSKLTYQKKKNYKKLILDGLYDVVLELDEDIISGDLNNYSFEENENDIKYTVSFPSWDFFFRQKLLSKDWSFSNYTYLEYITGTKVHKAQITISSDSDILILPITIVLDGKRDLDNENVIKSHLLTGGAQDVFEKYRAKTNAALDIVEVAYQKLFKHRNLCEDFVYFSPVDIEEIALCASIVVSPEIEIEKVYAQILFEVGQFLAPNVLFHSLEDLINEDLTIENIFEGPTLNHGFIKDTDLVKSELQKEIHVSDLINIIMDIKGVVAIEKIQLGSSYNGVTVSKGEKWILKLGEGRAPRLRPNMADLIFYKGLIPYSEFNWSNIELYYEELVQSIRNAKLKEDTYDRAKPKGTYLDVADYISVHEEFPLVYGVSKKGIPGLVDDKRRAQAKQLKAYLTLYDQLLANYLSQLSHLKDIFSYHDDIDRTYFYQLPYAIPDATDTSKQHMKDGIPEIYKLLYKFTNSLSTDAIIDKYKTYSTDWETFAKNETNDFVEALSGYTEDTKTFEDRRNRFLDHLMARFAEQFTDYVLLMYSMDTPRAPGDLIEDKIAFLKDYVEISSDRGKAFNYKSCPDLWTSETATGDNVSGYEKRLARLTGIERYDRRSLLCVKLKTKYNVFKGADNQWYFNFGLPGEILLKSEGYTTKQNCIQGIDSVVRNGIERKNYMLKTAVDGSFYFNLLAKNRKIIGTSPMYVTEQERNDKSEELITTLEEHCNIEGFHLLEHILLRPKDDTYDLMPVCVEQGCNSCLGLQDPYSFRMTLVLPAWIGRFTDMRFRHYFEQIARLEAPANTHVKICWVDSTDMDEFEKAYKKWLKALCKDNMTPALNNKLIQKLNDLNSIYPEGTLHECAEDDNENPIILGHTNIGSTKI